jgi:hypothetical protein
VELERSGHRDKFELVTRWAVRPLDLLRELRKLKPTVVHFSGHGARVQRRAGRRSGLCFQGVDGRPQIVSTTALQETFGAAGASVKLIVLSACYSEAQAEALLEHVDCVVGMRGALRDDVARTFAVGFYGGLGEQQSIEAAYKQGRAAISLDGLPDSDQPQLRARTGVDAGQLVLTGARSFSQVSTALAQLIASTAGADAFKAFVAAHKEILLSVPPPLGLWQWMEIVTDFHVDHGWRPHFTQFNFTPPDCQLASRITFVVLNDVKTRIFLEGTTETPEIRNIEQDLHDHIKAVHDNYDEYCNRAVVQDIVRTIPLSVLLSRPPYFEAILVAGRRRHLTQGQLDYLAKRNGKGPAGTGFARRWSDARDPSSAQTWPAAHADRFLLGAARPAGDISPRAALCDTLCGSERRPDACQSCPAGDQFSARLTVAAPSATTGVAVSAERNRTSMPSN